MVAAKMPQRPTILPTTFAAGFNDVPTTVCRKVPTTDAAATPQRPTMVAARFNETRRRNAATASHRKNRPKTHPEKTAFRGWFTWQVGSAWRALPPRGAAGRHWPSQVASALWRRAAHRDCFAPESAPEAIAFPFSRRCRAGSLSQVRRVGCSCRVRHLNAAVTYFDE
jgi:hypothetical protein